MGGGGSTFSLPFPMTDPAQQYQYLNQQGVQGAMANQANIGTGNMGTSTNEAMNIGTAGQRAAMTAAGTAIQEDQLINQANIMNQQAKNQQAGSLGGLLGGIGL